jgi:hypothetical protein
VPCDKILFPRRMLYVEAVLYATIAAAAFGLGYLAGRGGPSAVKDAENASLQKRVPVEGKVWLASRGGTKRGNEGAVVIVLPAGKLPAKRLSIARLVPGDPPAAGDATLAALAEFGGAATRADATGGLAPFFVPAAGSYRILVLSPQATGEPVAPLEKPDISELGKYFDAPPDFWQRWSHGWLTKDLRLGVALIDVGFRE